MDKRIKYRIVLDTETTPIDKTCRKVDPTNMFVYDIGWAVVDKHGKVYKTQSFVIQDIFIQEADLMQSAYYANKIPQYKTAINNGSRILTSFYKVREALIKDIELFNVTEIYAHNMYFDLLSLNNTERWLTKSKYRYFFPYGIEINDTLKMAKDVIGKQPTYIKYCNDNNYVTSSGRPRFTAEILYRYITQNENFTENHTGLEDVMIEKEILAYCFRQHKKMRKALFEKQAD